MQHHEPNPASGKKHQPRHRRSDIRRGALRRLQRAKQQPLQIPEDHHRQQQPSQLLQRREPPQSRWPRQRYQ